MTLIVLSLVTLLAVLQRVASVPNVFGAPPKVAAAWYAGWHAKEGFPLSSVHWEKYNTLIYSFAVTTPSVNSLSLVASDPQLLPEFVYEAHNHGVSAHVAIGGWGGGLWFSTGVATAENRTAFVKTIVDFAEAYDLDGINFDWEFPTQPGIGCNIHNASDTEHFLSFLQELRATSVGARLTLSAATSLTPFRDASGQPSTDVSGFAQVLDYIAIMNYDVWGRWSPAVGPNSPLNDECAPADYQFGSAISALKAWTAAKMPVDKIVLGVPSYGHSFSVAPSDALTNGPKPKLVPYPKFNTSNQPVGGAWDDTGNVDACGVFQGPGGTFELRDLVNEGYLNAHGNPAPGIYYRYDKCSQTPYVYNKTSEVMISFDNAVSFAAKGNYIKRKGLRGFAMWEAGGDYYDMLLDSIRNATGF